MGQRKNKLFSLGVEAMSRKPKMSAEEKIKSVEFYLSGGMGYTAVYTSVGVDSLASDFLESR